MTQTKGLTPVIKQTSYDLAVTVPTPAWLAAGDANKFPDFCWESPAPRAKGKGGACVLRV